MKTISIALVSASLLALTACGGGNKSTNNTITTNSAGLETTNTVTDYGTTNTLGTTNTTLDTNTSTTGTTGTTGNTTVTNTTTTTNTTSH